MLVTLLLLALLGALLLLTSRGQVRPFHLTFAALSVIVIGYARLAPESAATQRSLDLYLPAVIAVVGGYLLTQGWAASHAVPVTAPTPPAGTVVRSPTGRAARRVSRVMVVLGVYHFVVVGIPLLSANPQIDRWSFTDSGLFGLPGRSMNFGIVVVLALAFAVTRGADRVSTRAIVLLPLVSLAAFRLAGGFKGGLLQLIVQVAFIQLVMRPPQNVGRALRRYGIWLAAALLFAAGVASLYQSTAERGDDTFGLVIDRATLLPAREGSELIELADRGVRIAPPNTMISDFRTLTMEYLPGFGGERDQFLAIYSGYLNDRSLIGEAFIVPVAPQALPVLYYNLGLRAWLAMFVVGAAFGLAEGIARTSRSPMVASTAIVLCLALHYFLLKGDLAFQLINWGMMAIFVLGGFAALRAVFSGEDVRANPAPTLELVRSPRR